MCSGVNLHWAVALHHHSMGLVAKDVGENQEVELFLLLVLADL